jgi:hypothetical protein
LPVENEAPTYLPFLSLTPSSMNSPAISAASAAAHSWRLAGLFACQEIRPIAVLGPVGIKPHVLHNRQEEGLIAQRANGLLAQCFRIQFLFPVGQLYDEPRDGLFLCLIVADPESRNRVFEGLAHDRNSFRSKRGAVA